MEIRIDCRGWKEICAFLGVKKATAKKILKRHGILRHDAGRPVLLIDDYRRAIARLLPERRP